MRIFLKIILFVLFFLFVIFLIGFFFIGGKYFKSNIFVFGIISLIVLILFVWIKKSKIRK